MGNELDELHYRLRDLSKLCIEYQPDRQRPDLHAFPTELRGYSEASLALAVYKKIDPPKFAQHQARFMEYLGDQVCPKILGTGQGCYFMEYLFPAEFHQDSLVMQEHILKTKVWNRDHTWIDHMPEEMWRIPLRDHINVEVPDWALGPVCVIHGDPTLDNVLLTKQGFVRITDPIPPGWLKKPSIQAVDYGKILQSLLGWEVVLRGAPFLQYSFPTFMLDYQEARRAVFWAMVAIKRIAFRDINDRVTRWATAIDEGLEDICASSS